MKKLLIILMFSLTATISLAQITEFEPQVLNHPNLDPDSLLQFENQKEAYQKLVNSNTPYESMTEVQKELYHKEMYFEVGPFGTAEMGCSWYCAAGPSDLNASSRLDSTSKVNYEPNNAHDFDLRTAWVEGKPDYGIGEELIIDFELEGILKITSIDIYNGYCKSEKVWKENSRVKILALYANDELLGHLNLADTYKGQRFEIGSLGGDTTGRLLLKFEIIEVYKGEKYMDTAISEINFDGTGDH